MDTTFKETGLPCPCGKSTDAYCLNEDNSGKCFRGDCTEGPLGNGFFPNKEFDSDKVFEEGDGVRLEYLPYRNISAKTYEFYKVQTKVINDIPQEVGFVFPNGAVQVRSLLYPKSDKRHFRTVGPMGASGCFGTDKFDPGSRESIIITEGAYDALAAYDILRNKFASISVKSVSSCLTEIERDWEYINSFDKIYLCLDNDEVGQAKVSQIAAMFDFNKVYHVKLTKWKDANEYLLNNDAFDFKSVVENSRRFSPKSIISGFGEIKEALKLKQAEAVADYPFENLQVALKGLHKGEFICIKGKQGIGKTEICRAIADTTLRNRDTKIATIFLEESMDTTIKGVATYQLKQPAMDEEAGLSDEDILNAYMAAVDGDDSRLYIHSHFSGDSETEIVDNLRFLVTVAGVDLVFLDNLTMLVSGREGEDERMRIDRIIRRLRGLVNELKFCLVLIAHTNDDGTTRGSRLPDILCNTVISMKREIPSTTLNFTVEKLRTQGGKAGPAGFAIYDTQEYVLKDPVKSVSIEVPKL